MLPTTKITEEKARETDERESFNVLNLLDSNFMCGKCDTKNGEKDPKSDARILETTPETPGKLGKLLTMTLIKLRGPDRVMANPKSIKKTRATRREEERPAQAGEGSTTTTDWSPIAR